MIMRSLMKGSLREILFEKRYPLWVLLLLTATYAIIFMVVVYPLN